MEYLLDLNNLKVRTCIYDKDLQTLLVSFEFNDSTIYLELSITDIYNNNTLNAYLELFVRVKKSNTELMYKYNKDIPTITNVDQIKSELNSLDMSKNPFLILTKAFELLS